jgi:tripartite-type tricarboxylate transporter receptor subunit TctC
MLIEPTRSMAPRYEVDHGRRRTLGALATGLAGASIGWPVLAASRVVTLVMPFAPGSLPDAQYRLLANELTTPERTLIIDNRSGASGAIGTRTFVRAKPDGSTLGFGGQGTIITNAYLFKGYGEEVSQRMVPVHGVTSTPMLLAARAGRPYKTMHEFVEYAKAHPGEINMGCIGLGTGAWQIYSLLKKSAGFETTDVTFNGSAATITALLGGQIDVIADFYINLKSHLESGKVVALGTSTSKRLAALPQVPTFEESGFAGTDITTWAGIFAPPGTPATVVDEWARDIGAALRKKSVADTFASQGSVPMVDMGPARLAEFIKTETPRWLELAQRVGLKVE